MISIIIPVYNAEMFLADTIESVLKQSYKDYEIVLVNDGSKDNSSKICHEYADKYEFVRVFDRDNRGPSASRNFGIDHASGEYVWFIDSDDILAENALSIAVKTQKKYDADVVIGGMNFCFAEEKKITPKKVAREFSFSASSFKNHYSELMNNNYLSSLWNKLIRRSVIVDNNIRMIEELFMYEDYVFSMDLLLKCECVVCVPEIFYNYQIRSVRGLARRYKPGVLGMFRILKDKVEGYKRALGAVDQIKDRLNDLLIYLAYECVTNESRSKESPVAKIRELLKDEEFSGAIAELKGLGTRIRIVHMLMKKRLAVLLFIYLKFSKKM